MLDRREVPAEEWRAKLAALNRRVMKGPEEVLVRVEDGEVRQPVGRRVHLLGVELERKGPSAGPVYVWIDGDEGQLGHRVPRPARMFVHEREDGEVAALEVEDASGSRTVIYTRAHPSYDQLSAELQWWETIPPSATPHW